MADAIEKSDMLAALQEAQKTLSEAIRDLAKHNQAEQAHPIILRLIQDMKDAKVYSRVQIREMIEEEIAEHEKKSLAQAHKEALEQVQGLSQRCAKLEAELQSLTARIDGSSNTLQSSLERALNNIELKYAPILESLQKSLADAEAINDRALSDSIKDQISEVLTSKRNELVATMEQWIINH